MTSGDRPHEGQPGDQRQPTHAPAREDSLDRRRRMRDESRTQHLGRRTRATEPDRWETPEWLDRSFVLPLTRPEPVEASSPAPEGSQAPGARTFPAQGAPTHDDLEPAVPAEHRGSAVSELALRGIVRPSTEEVDFARVVRRSDLCWLLARIGFLTLMSGGVALIGYLVTGSQFALGALTVLVLTSIACGVARVRLEGARVPYVGR